MHFRTLFPIIVFGLLLCACEMQTDSSNAKNTPPPVILKNMGVIEAEKLKEASGLQASRSNNGKFFSHNDDGKPVIFMLDESGGHLGNMEIKPAKNKDWEDITSIPVGDDRWLVVGDIGDNGNDRKNIKLYFVKEPKPDLNDRYSGDLDLQHRLTLVYPDGPRDCESMSYDPIGNQLLLLTKRDKPARLYAIDLQTALDEDKAELEFLGTISALRPPTIADRVQWGGRADWISQPTGLDISPDGSEAAVITYRSLYRFHRKEGEDWLTAMQKNRKKWLGRQPSKMRPLPIRSMVNLFL